MSNPWTLKFWQSGEYQTAREKLDDDQKAGYVINPERKEIFRALRLTPEATVRAVILGQAPHSDHRFATGVAFSVPRSVSPGEFPPAAGKFLEEYSHDLGYDRPTHGCLEDWCAQGVLLWNAIPSCRQGQSLSHDWPGREWDYLTAEIIERLSPRGVVFAFLGTVAKRFRHLVQEPSRLINLPYPTAINTNRSFLGSRLFSTINANLVELGLEPIEWRLDGSISRSNLPGSTMGGNPVLPNITGADLGGLKGKTLPSFASSTFELEVT